MNTNWICDVEDSKVVTTMPIIYKNKRKNVEEKL